MKAHRNEPCPCGSGRKYKKCCAEQPTPLKNPFRDGQVSEEEMLERDQRATYLELKNQKEMIENDLPHLKEVAKLSKAHLEGALVKLKTFGGMILALPKSEAGQAILVSTKGQVEQIEQKIKQIAAEVKQCKLNRAKEVILALLEEKFGVQGIADKGAIEVGPNVGPYAEPPELKDD